jgi:hypothetical protein
MEINLYISKENLLFIIQILSFIPIYFVFAAIWSRFLYRLGSKCDDECADVIRFFSYLSLFIWPITLAVYIIVYIIYYICYIIGKIVKN